MKPRQARSEAVRRIKKARAEESFSLDLGDLSLTELPQELGSLTELRILTLGSRRVENARWWEGEHYHSNAKKYWFDNLEVLRPLTKLTHLGLAWCDRLNDLDPLVDLINLQNLDLEYCNAIRDIRPLRGLTNLRVLNLSGSEEGSVGDIGPLRGLTNLRVLDLGGCDDLFDITPLAGLINLQELNLCSTKVRNLAPLARLTNLRILDCGSCGRLRDISALAHLNNLQSLDIYRCSLLSNIGPLANLVSLQSLDLSSCEALDDIRPLKRLANLRTLNLRNCKVLRDIRPLTHLANLESLDLSSCEALHDINPLAHLSNLWDLNLSSCKGLSNLEPLAQLSGLHTLTLRGLSAVGSFRPLRMLLDTLGALYLHNSAFDDLPKELCGKDYDNVLRRVQAHFADLEQGAREDVELKLFVLGNGGVGKTQLCRRLRGEPFDPSIPSTHGVQLGQVLVPREEGSSAVQLCCWDFGGQDIYHGTHALFLQSQAVFVILWTPDHEDGETSEGGIPIRNRPLTYWLDYIRGLAGTDSPVLVVQGHCDSAKHRQKIEIPAEDFRYLQTLEFSARTDLGLEMLTAHLQDAVSTLLDNRSLQQIGVGRIQVRDQLRAMLKEGTRTLDHDQFRALCAETGKVSDPDALLDFLHCCGVLFYQSGLFQDRIILDQTWALDAIYTLFHRQAMAPFLLRDGRFTRAQLSGLVWQHLPLPEQDVILGMMRSCGICFPAYKSNASHNELLREYISPDLLPEWSEARASMIDRLCNGSPDDEAVVRYRFLHEGILRTFLSQVGEQAGDDAVYWKYGCWFCEEKTGSMILVQSHLDIRSDQSGAGNVSLQAWGKEATTLVDRVLKTLLQIPVGQPPEVKHGVKHRDQLANLDDVKGVETLAIVPRSRLPNDGSRRVYVSYAWGDDTDTGRQREALVERLCDRLRMWEYDVIRDKETMRNGDLISTFMKTIGTGDRVVVVLSEKYLRSLYCVTELHEIYRVSRGEKEHFLGRIIPLTLADAAIGTIRDRIAHGRYWKNEYESLQRDVSDGLLGPTDLVQWWRIGRWVADVNEMLAYINDQLHPFGFDAIVANDFAAVKGLLERRP
jgi:internalin A